MAEELQLTPGITREQRYKELFPQIKAVISEEQDLIANMANVSAMLKTALPFFWVGFYRNIQGELVLGPFQGPLACTRIAFGKGVCGKAAETKEIVTVPNVHAFPGHIACSSETNSEIVLPLVYQGETQLVLDVDSTRYDDFSALDASELSKIIDLLLLHHWS